MKRVDDYCPLVGTCPYEPVCIIPDSYFLIQPFDSEKEDREKAVADALRKFYGGDDKYELRRSDSKIYNTSSYCDICLKIKSSQFCIVDISGELHETIDKESGKNEPKIFLRPNVALELGLAYGFNTQAYILSRKLNGKRQIPSDIEFVRYIDISYSKFSLIDFRGWSVASQKLLDQLRESVPLRPIKESLDLDNRKLKKDIKRYYEQLLHFKDRLPSIRNKSFRISQVIYKYNKLIGIIENAEALIEDICFNFYVSENEIEELRGQLKVYLVQPNGLAQVEFYMIEGCEDYLNKVARCCLENGNFDLGKHRLELIIPEDIEKTTSEVMRNIIRYSR
jgi:hypothetical protein